MTDAAVHASLEEKVGKCIVNWQSREQQVQRKMSQLPKLLEAPNPTLLVLNLTRVPVGNVGRVIQEGGADEAQKNKGARVTFLVLKVISGGWTWVGAPGSEKETGGGQKGGKPKAGKIPPEAKEKLNTMMGDHLLMHTYDLTNLRGTYVKSARSEECLCISPGMVLSMMVWGKGFLNVFKDQKGEDLQAFDIAMVQLSTKSTSSTGMTSGNMLEVKNFTKNSYPSLNLLGTRLLPTMAKSLVDSAVMRSRFLDGSHLPPAAEGTKNKINQEWLKGSISNTVSIVKVTADQGTFAIGPDDVLRFHVTQPLADLPCAQMTVQCDAGVFGADNKDWVCKLFNVLTLMGAMELLVILDSYKASKLESEGEDSVLEGFARVDVPALIERLLTKKLHSSGLDVSYVKEAFGEAAAKQMAVFKLEGDVSVVFDTRLLSKKHTVEVGIKTTLVHPNSAWERGHALHFFFGGRLVHYVVVPLAADGGVDGNKHVLSTIAAPVEWDEVEIEQTENINPNIPTTTAEKKRKRPATAAADE